RTAPVSRFLATTVAADVEAPEAWVTTPEMAADTWAAAGSGPATRRKRQMDAAPYQGLARRSRGAALLEACPPARRDSRTGDRRATRMGASSTAERVTLSRMQT